MFVQLDELSIEDEVWYEKARWIKCEEKVNEMENKWQMSPVSPISFQCVLELRKCIEYGKLSSVLVPYVYGCV